MSGADISVAGNDTVNTGNVYGGVTPSVDPLKLLDLLLYAFYERNAFIPDTSNASRGPLKLFHESINSSVFVRSSTEYMRVIYRRCWNAIVPAQEKGMSLVRSFGGLYLMTAQMNLLQIDTSLCNSNIAKHLGNEPACEMIWRMGRFMEMVCGALNPIYELDKNYSLDSKNSHTLLLIILNYKFS